MADVKVLNAPPSAIVSKILNIIKNYQSFLLSYIKREPLIKSHIHFNIPVSTKEASCGVRCRFFQHGDWITPADSSSKKQAAIDPISESNMRKI